MSEDPSSDRTARRVARLIEQHHDGADREVASDRVLQVLEAFQLSPNLADLVTEILRGRGFRVVQSPSPPATAPGRVNPSRQKELEADALLHDLRMRPRRLLKAAEERHLGAIIAAGRDAEKAIVQTESASGRHALEVVIRRGEEAGRQFELHNLKLVHHYARRLNRQGLEYEDLVQEGWFGLRRAVEKWDPSLGLKFSTYATWWIRQTMTRAIADKSRAIRLPVHVHEKLAKVVRVRGRLMLETGSARPADIATQAGFDEETVKQLLGLARGPASLDSPLGDGNNTLAGMLPDRRCLPFEERAARWEVMQAVRQVLAALSARDADILSRRFGLHDDVEETLEEIGRDYCLTRERIRQIQDKALARLEWNPTLRALMAS